jgi:hypothetical protein
MAWVLYAGRTMTPSQMRMDLFLLLGTMMPVEMSRLMAYMALGMMPMMHLWVRDGQLKNPGPFAAALGPMTAMGFLMLHLLFGVLAGAPYEAFI